MTMRLRDVIDVDEMEWLIGGSDRYELSETISVYYWGGPPDAACAGWYVYDTDHTVDRFDTLAEAIRCACAYAAHTGQKIFKGERL